MVDIHSDTWGAVSKFVEQSLQDARQQLESPTLDHDRSQYLRGRIAALCDVLALTRDPTPLAPKTTGY
ncbi:hypothetical protein GCM10027202_17720 [Microvirgula curvata]